MNGKATLVDRVLEAVRQRDLTNRLGQRTCDEHDPMYDGICYICGAAV